MAVEENAVQAPAPTDVGAAPAEPVVVEAGPAPVVPATAATLSVEPVGAATLGATYEVGRYPVAPGYRVYVRNGPGTSYGVIRLMPYGAIVPIYCQKAGERVTGPYGSSNLWDCIANGEFVSDAYVHTGSDGYVATRCA
ncbi:SH3 domain-containing protein [Streptomyces sp. NBC_01218]|uniref:SH3 domain-containing protein n=1 Tax=unclassified Streptomyces TaxID=2593676 RepID=UPI002E102FB8|nr:SH3 domain-containing protein [Streptomyces sp. NBC_01218]